MRESNALKTATFASKLPPRLIGGMLCGIVLAACTGCQTFSLSEEEFQRQQRGQMADPETGAVVGLLGSVGFFGAMIGAAVDAAGK